MEFPKLLYDQIVTFSVSPNAYSPPLFVKEALSSDVDTSHLVDDDVDIRDTK